MKILLSKTIATILKNNICCVATSSLDGKPNVIQIFGIEIWRNKLLITDNFMDQTLKNIRENNQIVTVVWFDNNSKGYKFIGEAKYYQDGKYYEYIKSFDDNRGWPCKGVIVITVEQIIKYIFDVALKSLRYTVSN